ncbi:MAG: hypothetical protein JXN60_02510, partial [Lentisphaerae bacterium]|nr:hypothetical protein [Lentisphaerota bacterium]
DPKDYRYSGYGESIGGNRRAREGISEVMRGLDYSGTWSQVRAGYRKLLFQAGSQKGLGIGDKPIKPGIDRQTVEKVLKAGGKLSRGELLQCRVRYFADGVALGSEEFVDKVFHAHREKFGKRSKGARTLKGGSLPGLFTVRELRANPIELSGASP